MTMIQRIFILVILTVLCTGAVHAKAGEPITLGIFPYISPGKLVKFHRPLKEYLSRVLDQPVRVVTAADFSTFLQRTHEESYDYILTAPHFGRLAEMQDNYQRVAASKHEVQGIYLARVDSGIQKLEDLQGKSIMMAGSLAIIHQMAKHQLEQMQLVNGNNITIKETRTHNNAMIAAARRESDAALTGIRIWKKLGGSYRDTLRVIGTTPRAPGFMVMANKNQDDKSVARMRDALLKFEDSPEGKIYIERSGFSGFRAIDNATMHWLDPYVKVLHSPN
jgi:phosphonate transport system substrate-binding protein